MKRLIYIIFLFLALDAGAQTSKSSTSNKASATTSVRRKTAQQNKQRTAQKRQPVYRDVTYIVNGNVNGYADGEWVRLCVPTANGLQAHDSVQVTDGKFQFKGTTKNVPHMQYVAIGEGMQKNITEVLLEEGTITMQLFAGEKKDRVTGTTHNDIYTPYRDSLNDIYTKLYACIVEEMNLSNSKEDRESYQAGADMLRRKVVDVSYDYANKNMTNWVGVYLFAEYYKRFTLQQNKTLLTKMSQKYGNLPITAEIRKYVNQQKP